jgi:molybdopterin synthase catalytic subunit
MAENEQRVLVRIQHEPLDAQEAMRAVASRASGATCLFVGTAREVSDGGREVTALHYESYGDLADKRMRDLAAEIFAKWPVTGVAMLHRVGTLDLGEAAVVIACSAPHRPEAFEACRHGIERLKQDVPIWKKETFTDGESEWVEGA